jgi:hypothetical protein
VPRGKEWLPKHELDPELVTAFAGTFIHRSDCYPIQLDAGTSYVTVKKPLTTELLIGHIRGVVTLGAYALDEESRAHWLCLDADDGEQWQGLRQLASHLEPNGITAYLEQSRRGGHCWLFTPPLPGKTVRQFGKQLIRSHNLGLEIELYPKQDELKGGVGSLVRLPLGVHQRVKKRFYFINSDGEPLAPSIREQMAILANPKRVPQVYIDQTLAQIQPPTPLPEKQTFAKVTVRGETPSERIKAAVSVYDFVSRFVELDQRGRGFCPFHDDQHMSFQVEAQGNYWSCYAQCGNGRDLPNGGSIIDFQIRMRYLKGQDHRFKATITELAKLLL